jgi:hypothetical protein
VSIAGFRIHPVFDGEGDGGRHGTEAGVGEEVDEVKVKVKAKKRKKWREEGEEGMTRKEEGLEIDGPRVSGT